jgi:preprotein translocase subunit SecE
MSADKPELDNRSDKRGLIANIALVVVWVYVAMIYLLACDQQFHWGIFSP